MFQEKCVEKIRSDFMCSNVFPIIVRLWDNVGKYLEPERPQMTMYDGACLLCNWSKNADTHSEYVIHIAFPRQQWFSRRHLIVTFVLYFACLAFMQLLLVLPAFPWCSTTIFFPSAVCSWRKCVLSAGYCATMTCEIFTTLIFFAGDEWGVGEKRSIHPDFLT